MRSTPYFETHFDKSAISGQAILLHASMV